MNTVLTLEQVLALPEGARVWVEHSRGYGESHTCAKMTKWCGCDVALMDEDGVCWRIDTHIPETAFGKLYRVWSLPQPPTPEEVDANPWEGA